jgi:hypothetical protein
MSLIASVRRSFFLLAMLSLFCSCHGSEWSNVRIADGYRRPTTGVNISIVASAEGSEPLMQDLTHMLVDALSDDGLEATVDLDVPTSAQLQLTIAEYEPQPRVKVPLVINVGGAGQVVVVVDLKDPHGKTLLHGSLRGYVAGGESKESLRAAAHSIAEAINSGVAYEW